MPDDSRFPILGSSFIVNIKLGFLIQIVVYIITMTVLLTVAKSDANRAISASEAAVKSSKDTENLINAINSRLIQLETRQQDFQNVYEHDASRYIRDLNDNYNRSDNKK